MRIELWSGKSGMQNRRGRRGDYCEWAGDHNNAQMAITTKCPGCSQTLKVKDEMAGKRIKCPKCQKAFSVAAAGGGAGGGAPAMVKGRPTGGSAGRVGGTVAKGSKPAGPKIAVSPGVVIGVSLVVVIALTVLLYVMFPMALSKQWEAQRPKAYEEVEAVAELLIAANGAEGSDPLLGTPDPHIHSIDFLFPPVAFSMPDQVGFVAVCGSGLIQGNYNPKTREITMNVQTDGSVNSAGIVLRQGKHSFNGTGRVTDGTATGEIGGKKAVRPVFDPRSVMRR